MMRRAWCWRVIALRRLASSADDREAGYAPALASKGLQVVLAVEIQEAGRADVWAFGCVLYEMLSGRRPFDGTDVTDVLAAVVRDAPTFDVLPPDVPPAARRLLRRCLEKDPSRRLDSMRDARLEIDDSSKVATLEQPVRRRGSAALLTAGALLAIPGLVLLGYALGRTTTPISAPPSHVELTVAPATSLGGPPARADRPTRHALVVTSDGTRIVFVGYCRRNEPVVRAVARCASGERHPRY